MLSSYAPAAPRQAPASHKLDAGDDAPPRPRRAVSLREWARRLFAPAPASRVISPFDAIQPGDAVILTLRVSRSSQDHNGNLDDQERALRRAAEDRGAVVVGTVRHVGSGQETTWLYRAAALARRKGAKLLATEASRFIRNQRFDPARYALGATEAELDDLARVTDGVTLVTLTDPDADLAELARSRSARGQESKGSGGRPATRDAFRSRWITTARDLRAEGHSFWKVARIIAETSGHRVTERTVRNWLSTDSKTSENVL